mmetsp:Transcript_55867/g.154711  ORF Transcript_55867/g.154711 Transcript_55867/m.154711 type:complete len:219 (+) Transcript_55867:196-852(+)
MLTCSARDQCKAADTWLLLSQHWLGNDHGRVGRPPLLLQPAPGPQPPGLSCMYFCRGCSVDARGPELLPVEDRSSRRGAPDRRWQFSAWCLAGGILGVCCQERRANAAGSERTNCREVKVWRPTPRWEPKPHGPLPACWQLPVLLLVDVPFGHIAAKVPLEVGLRAVEAQQQQARRRPQRRAALAPLQPHILGSLPHLAHQLRREARRQAPEQCDFCD